jgi:hypothetical protein
MNAFSVSIPSNSTIKWNVYSTSSTVWVNNWICYCMSSSYFWVMGTWQDNSWILSCKHSMVLLDSIKLFSWEQIFALKSTSSFSRHLVHSITILSLCASIVTTSSNDFWLVSIFLYSTSNSVLSTYKWFRSTKITISLSWWVWSWAWYSSFLARDLSNQICILAK